MFPLYMNYRDIQQVCFGRCVSKTPRCICFSHTSLEYSSVCLGMHKSLKETKITHDDQRMTIQDEEDGILLCTLFTVNPMNPFSPVSQARGCLLG